MPSQDNKAALETALHAFNDHQRRDEYFRLYADEAVLHRAPPLAPGLQAIKEWYRSLWRAFPDVPWRPGERQANRCRGSDHPALPEWQVCGAVEPDRRHGNHEADQRIRLRSN